MKWLSQTDFSTTNPTNAVDPVNLLDVANKEYVDKKSRTLLGGAWSFPDNTINAATDLAANYFFWQKPMWYQITSGAAGTITQRSSSSFGSNFYYTAANALLVTQNCTEPLVCVTGANATDMDALCSSSTNTTTAVNTLVSFCTTNGFAGVEIDFEAFGSWTASQYTNYKTFLTTLGTTLHANNLKLMVDVPPIWNNTMSTTSNEWTSRNSQGYYQLKYEDFNALPVDYIVPMCYDYHYDEGAGTPTQPLAWLDAILAWAKSKITDNQKIVAGLPAAGYYGATGGYTITGATYAVLSASPGFSNATRDTSSAELTWTNNGNSYFALDDQAINTKIHRVMNNGLYKYSLWHLGNNKYGTLVTANSQNFVDLSSNQTKTGSLTVPIIDKGSQVFNVKAYGATGNTKTVTDGAMTASSATLTSATASFTSADIGKTISVSGAGSSGVTLTGTISAYTNATTVTLSATASTTVTNATVIYGTNDTTALQAALNAVNTAGGGKVLVPPGTYSINAPLVIYSNTNLELDNTAMISLANGSNCNMLIDHAHYVGDLTVPSVMTNITVQGGTWERNNNAGVNLNLHTIILGGNNLTLKNMKFQSTGATAGKYAIDLQNAVHFTVENITGNTYHADLVHVSGPASFGFIRNIYALSNGDDMVAFTTNDVTPYQFGNEGDITDMQVDNVFANALPIAHLVAIYSGKTTSGTPLNTKRIKVRNVQGTMTSGANSAVFIGDFDSGYLSGGYIDGVVLDGIDVQWLSTGVTKPLIDINPNSPATSLGIGHLKISNITISSDFGSIIQNAGPISSLIVTKVSGATATTAFPSAGSFLYQWSSYGTITDLYLSNIDLTLAGTSNGSLIKVSTGSLSKVFVHNVSLNNFFALYDTVASASLMVAGLNLINCAQQLNIRTGATVVVRGWNNVVSNTSSNGTIAGSLRSLSFDFPVDVSNANLQHNSGDKAYNTNSSVAGGVGPVISDGTSWYTINPPIKSVFGRTGVVTAQSGDYTAAQVGAAQGLVPTAVKTANYTASAGDFVPVDVTSGSVTITLPTAPADKTRIAVKLITVSGSNTVTVTTGGTDVINKAGTTSLSLSLLNQGLSLQYSSSTAIWYAVVNYVPLSQTDARYAQLTNNLSDLSSVATARTNLGLGSLATLSSIDLTANVGTTILPLANGGTGQSTRQAAINALTGTQSAGTYLRSDGTNATLSSIQAADVPTLNQNTTGTAANVTGTVAIANGGTNATTASVALSNLGGLALTGGTMTGELITVASTATTAGFNLPQGVAPTTPVTGDVWFDGSNIYVRNNASSTIKLVGTTGFTMNDGANIGTGTTTGTKIGLSTSQKIGFFNATPVVQQATTGTTTGYTTGTSTAVTIDGKFTGNTGTTAYTIADIVLALKKLGLLAS